MIQLVQFHHQVIPIILFCYACLSSNIVSLVDGAQFAGNSKHQPALVHKPGLTGALPVAAPAAAAEGEARAGSHWSLPNRPSLFSIIRFPNEECFDSSNQSGTCYTPFECKLLGGQPSSPCAAGFGACCIVSRTCHVTTREKVVYFKNPSFPSADSEEKFCDLTVEMNDPNVCQLRLDFLDFQLDPPSQGACREDYLEISATGMPPNTVPRLCGLNRNQHLYISVAHDYSAERSASIVFYTDPVGDHRWQLKVTQIDCNQYRPFDWRRPYQRSPLWAPHPALTAGSRFSTTFASGFQTAGQTASALAYDLLRPQFTPRAPMGCLQYFTQPSGIIESFNFGHYLNNMDYSICLRRQPDTCRVVLTSSDYDWSLNGVGVPGATSGVGDQDCARDYLLIPGASRTGDGFTYDRYCGGRLHYLRGQTLSAPLVTKSAGPLVLRFHSDAFYETVNNGGFRLQYEQSAQDCVYHTPEEAGSLASQQVIASTLSDSRPFMNDVPVMYAAQQLSMAPLVLANNQGGASFADQQQQQQQQPLNLVSHQAPPISIDQLPVAGTNFSTDRRSDSAGPVGGNQLFSGGGGGGGGGKSLLLDLNKAFQLVSSRAARELWL